MALETEVRNMYVMDENDDGGAWPARILSTFCSAWIATVEPPSELAVRVVCLLRFWSYILRQAQTCDI